MQVAVPVPTKVDAAVQVEVEAPEAQLSFPQHPAELNDVLCPDSEYLPTLNFFPRDRDTEKRKLVENLPRDSDQRNRERQADYEYLRKMLDDQSKFNRRYDAM